MLRIATLPGIFFLLAKLHLIQVMMKNLEMLSTCIQLRNVANKFINFAIKHGKECLIKCNFSDWMIFVH